MVYFASYSFTNEGSEDPETEHSPQTLSRLTALIRQPPPQPEESIYLSIFIPYLHLSLLLPLYSTSNLNFSLPHCLSQSAPLCTWQCAWALLRFYICCLAVSSPPSPSLNLPPPPHPLLSPLSSGMSNLLAPPPPPYCLVDWVVQSCQSLAGPAKLHVLARGETRANGLGVVASRSNLPPLSSGPPQQIEPPAGRHEAHHCPMLRAHMPQSTNSHLSSNTHSYQRARVATHAGLHTGTNRRTSVWSLRIYQTWKTRVNQRVNETCCCINIAQCDLNICQRNNFNKLLIAKTFWCYQPFFLLVWSPSMLEVHLCFKFCAHTLFTELLMYKRNTNS